MLRATTACTFSTSQLPKVVRTWCVLYILTWKCASRHNGVQFFISHLASWLRTRRFSEAVSPLPWKDAAGVPKAPAPIATLGCTYHDTGRGSPLRFGHGVAARQRSLRVPQLRYAVLVPTPLRGAGRISAASV